MPGNLAPPRGALSPTPANGSSKQNTAYRSLLPAGTVTPVLIPPPVADNPAPFEGSDNGQQRTRTPTNPVCVAGQAGASARSGLPFPGQSPTLVAVTDAPAWLALETSVAAASLAVGDPGGVFWREEFTSDRSHNAVLFDPLERALRQIPGRTLEVVLIGTGPGSYSGTRVGIAAGQGIAIARTCPAVGVPSLLGTAESADGPSLAVGDARRGGWWQAVIEDGRLTSEPTIEDHDRFVEKVAAAVGRGWPVIAFDPLARLKLPADLGTCIVAGNPTADRLISWWAERSAAERRQWTEMAPQPVYLRPPHVTEAKTIHPLLRGLAG